LLTPWLLHNSIRQQSLFPLQVSKSVVWLASPEYYHLVRDQGYAYEQIWKDVLYSPDAAEHNPNSVAGDRWWTDRALQSIAAEPLVYLSYAVEKIGTFWVGDPNADWGDTQVFNYQGLLRIGLPPLDAKLFMIGRILTIVALVAALVVWPKWRTLLPVYALLLYSNLLHAATHAEARLSDPLQPFLLIMLAAAIPVVWKATARRVSAYRHH
jgi:hypothetical protein